MHKAMEMAGYPVAELLDSGKLGYRYYFLERSLGDAPLGDLFAADYASHGNISEEHFSQLLKIAEHFARAQMGTQTSSGPAGELSVGIFLEVLCDELPEHAKRIRERFDQAFERLSVFPFVLSHGDFNPRNLFSAGVIDLEHFFQAPFGYDSLTALVHIDLHPDKGDYEFYAKYRYSDEQRKRYFAMLDRVAQGFELPPISKYADDFAFLRAVWSTVRLHEWPKLQKWRYDFLVRRYLS